MCVSEGGERERVVRVRARVSGKWWVVDVCACVREGAKVERWYDMIRYDTMEVFDAQTF